MTLKPCRSCQQAVSIGRGCPHCGAYSPAPPSWPKPTTTRGKVGLAVVVVLLVLIGPIGWLMIGLIPFIAHGWTEGRRRTPSASETPPDGPRTS